MAWVDALKFLGIFAIYLGHFGDMGGQFYLFVFTYHVPLFFMASGFFFKPPKWRELRSFFLKKFRAIMVPYYIFAFLNILISFVKYNYESGYIIPLLYEALLGRRNHVGPIWFLTGIFSVMVICALLNCLLRNRYAVLAVSFLLYSFYPKILTWLHIEPLSLLWNLDSVLDYLVYFVLGWCVYPLLTQLELQIAKSPLSRTIFGLCTACTTGITAIVYFKGGYFLSGLLPCGNFLRIPELLQTMILILFNCICARFLIHVPYLQELGRNTLILCGCESASKMVLESLLELIGVSPVYTSPLTTIFYTGICLAFCYQIFVRFILAYLPVAAGSTSRHAVSHPHMFFRTKNITGK